MCQCSFFLTRFTNRRNLQYWGWLFGSNMLHCIWCFQTNIWTISTHWRLSVETNVQPWEIPLFDFTGLFWITNLEKIWVARCSSDLVCVLCLRLLHYKSSLVVDVLYDKLAGGNSVRLVHSMNLVSPAPVPRPQWQHAVMPSLLNLVTVCGILWKVFML